MDFIGSCSLLRGTARTEAPVFQHRGLSPLEPSGSPRPRPYDPAKGPDGRRRQPATAERLRMD
ncbi:hypothetical protein GCM10017752_28160 [Streptomyces roseoviridis]